MDIVTFLANINTFLLILLYILLLFIFIYLHQKYFPYKVITLNPFVFEVLQVSFWIMLVYSAFVSHLKGLELSTYVANTFIIFYGLAVLEGARYTVYKDSNKITPEIEWLLFNYAQADPILMGYIKEHYKTILYEDNNVVKNIDSPLYNLHVKYALYTSSGSITAPLQTEINKKGEIKKMINLLRAYIIKKRLEKTNSPD